MLQKLEEMQLKDTLRMFNGLVERCFSECVVSFRSKALTATEEKCVSTCAEKYMKHSVQQCRPSRTPHTADRTPHTPRQRTTPAECARCAARRAGSASASASTLWRSKRRSRRRRPEGETYEAYSCLSM